MCLDLDPVATDGTLDVLNTGASYLWTRQDAHLTTQSGCPLRESLKRIINKRHLVRVIIWQIRYFLESQLVKTNFVPNHELAFVFY